MGFTCTGCDAVVDPPEARCPRCGSFPIYRSSHTELNRAISGEPSAALPDIPDRVHMGEGTTALVGLYGPAERTWGKLESSNPTCSFKDRGSALTVGAAVGEDTPLEAIVVASTGNTSSSVAAYAARAGVPCAIVVPVGTGSVKLAQAAAHDAAVFEVDGTFSACFELAETVATDERVVNATAVYSANPYVASANRAVAFELVDELGRAPDWVIVPVGAGPLLGGINAGFAELEAAGIIDTTPRLCGVQARGCHPIVRAMGTDEPVTPWNDPIESKIGAIADPLRGYAADGEFTRQAIAESGGSAIALDDAQILAWRDRLATREGIYAEPASAAAVAAIEAAPPIEASSEAVAIVTGHGLKERESVAIHPAGPANAETVRAAILDG